METDEQRPWIGVCAVPAFVECPRTGTGFFGSMLDAIFGVRTKPNLSKFAGRIVAVPSNFQEGDIWLHPSGDIYAAGTNGVTYKQTNGTGDFEVWACPDSQSNTGNPA